MRKSKSNVRPQTTTSTGSRLSQTKVSTSKISVQQTTNDPALSRSFRGHEQTITSVDFDPKMRQVASASKDSIVYVWNFKPQQRPFKFVGHKGPIYCVKYNPSGDIIASSGEDRQIRLWQNTVQSKCSIIKAHCGAIRSLNFSNDGAYILSASDDKTLKLWRLSDKKFLYSLASHKNWVRSGVISPDMRLIGSGSDDRTVKLWDFNSQALISTYNDHLDTVSQVLFHPDGTCLITSSFDQKIKITDVRSNRLIQHYNAHDSPVNSISIHPSGYFLASTGSDSKIKIWDLRQGRQIYTLYSNDKEINTINFNQFGDYFVTGGSQNLCMVWKTNFEQSIQSIEKVHQTGANQTEYSTGGVYTSTLFKSNKAASRSPTRKTIQFSSPDQFQDTFNRNDDELINAAVYEHKQSSSPTFSQQQQKYQVQSDLPLNSGLEIVGNSYKIEKTHIPVSAIVKSQNDSIASKQNVPFHPSTDFQTSIVNPTSQSVQQPNFINSSVNYQPSYQAKDDNLMTETIAASMLQISNRLDSMVQFMSNLDNRVAQQEQLSKSMLQNNSALGQSYAQTLDNKKQTFNSDYQLKQNDQSLSASLNDRNIVNIFQQGALANTGSIEACIINKQEGDDNSNSAKIFV